MLKFTRPLVIICTCINLLLIMTKAIPIQQVSAQCDLEISSTPSTCTTTECTLTASIILQNMNASVNPCDNFYDFVCGNFPIHNIIPDDKSDISGFTLIQDVVLQQTLRMLEEPIKDGESRSFVLAKQLYKLCYDTKTIEENGIAPIQIILGRLGGWPVVEGSNWIEEKFNWISTVYNIQKENYSVSSLLRILVSKNTKNSLQYVINIDQQSFDFVNRDNLIAGLENNIVNAYFEYAVELAVLMGADKTIALSELKEVIEFEIELAKITIPIEELRNVTLIVNHMSIQNISERFNGIPWLEFINEAISPGEVNISKDEVIVVASPSYITNLLLLLNRTSNRILHNHLILNVVIDTVPYLSEKFRKSEQKFNEVNFGSKASAPRWKECVKVVNNYMSIATSALYVRKYFSEDSRNTAEQLVKDLRNTFRNNLKDINWMDAETKVKALEKEEAMVVYVGYLQELMVDQNIEEYYIKLNFSSSKYLEVILKIKNFYKYKQYGKLRRVDNKTDWAEYDQAIIVNAYYDLWDNSIIIPAAILQGVFFSKDLPHYMNYGSLGFLIGHEIIHGFDDQGRNFDKNGEISEWWKEEAKDKFLEEVQCFINQYGNYTAISVNTPLNGIITQGENIADNGGVSTAYDAYEKWIKQNGEEPLLPGLNYTSRQMFWISAARSWCQNQRQELLKHIIQTDTHSPAEFRILGAFSNSYQFSKDFQCPLGSPMNPSNKCKIW